MRLRGTLVAAALAAVAVAGLAPPALRADYKDSYKAGMQAYERRDWAAAERSLSEAVALKPAEAPGGLLARAYLPYAYLGLARAARGDCRGAIQAWDESQRQSALRKSPDVLKQVQGARRTCEAKIADVGAAIAEADREISRARDLGAQLAALSRAPELASAWDSGSPSFASREAEARELLRGAQARRQQGESATDAAAVRDAGGMAGRAASAFATLAADAARQRERLGAELQVKRAALARVAEATKPSLRAAAGLEPAPRSVARARAALDASIRQATSGADALSLEAMAALQARIGREQAALDALIQRPPAPLPDAIAAWLGGDYARTASLLETAAPADPRLLAQTCLLRGAARHALYLVGGAKDATLLAAATADVAACKALGRNAPVASPKIFPPAFVALWSATPAAAPPPKTR